MNKKINKKLKVLWLCGFTNSFVQTKLKPRKKGKEIAPWITNLIGIFENSNDIELHIVSPHQWISNYKTFQAKGVTYHFINQGIPLIGKNWPSFFQFDLWTDYYFIKKSVARIVNRINPDIIHLHGAENTYHSPAIMQFTNKYPVLITLQGFLHKLVNGSENLRTKRRAEREVKIYKTFKHYGVRTKTMGEVVTEINPEAVLHWHGMVMENTPQINITDKKKKYNIVFFAKVTKLKGIEDLLYAVKLIKITKEDISVLIIGNTNQKYLEFLKNLCRSYKIENNITWSGFLPTQNDVFEAASTAKISVLPTHYDMIPGTIIESLFLKLPVVSYNTGSIHEINENEEIVSLVRVGDIDSLAKEIVKLITDEKFRKVRAEKGYIRAKEMFDDSKIKGDLLMAYNKVIEDFRYEKDTSYRS